MAAVESAEFKVLKEIEEGGGVDRVEGVEIQEFDMECGVGGDAVFEIRIVVDIGVKVERVGVGGEVIIGVVVGAMVGMRSLRFKGRDGVEGGRCNGI